MSFDYPIDSSKILLNRRKLFTPLKNPKKQINVAVLGASTTDELCEQIKYFFYTKNISCRIFQSNFGQFMSESLDPSDELINFKPDFIYVHTSIKSLKIYDVDLNNHADFVDSHIKDFNMMAESLKLFNCPIILNNYEFPDLRLFGNIDRLIDGGLVKLIDSINTKIHEIINNKKFLYLNDINYLSAKLGLDLWFDDSQWYKSKYSTSISVIPALVKNIGNIIIAITGETKKVVALDLDNTLWGGVIGDDGASKIKIGEGDPIGEGHFHLQKLLALLKSRGVLLTINSKNDIDNVKKSFKSGRNFLKIEDFSYIAANWERKDLNLLETAQALNLGADSFVFIDDNPAEQSIVRDNILGISVPKLHKNVEDYPKFLFDNGFFETISFSNEDKERANIYKKNLERDELRHSLTSYSDYLKSLEMTSFVENFNSNNSERVVQLLNKTNQFNFLTNRYTYEELNKKLSSKNEFLICANLNDKFGDNGIISIVGGYVDKKSFYIDNFVMSCRVLKRGMEDFILNNVIDIARGNGCSEIVGMFKKSEKNSMVKNFYQDRNFNLELVENSIEYWHSELESISVDDNFIQKGNK